MSQAVAWLILLALVAAVVTVFVRANRREHAGERASFLPQSSVGQLAAVALGLVVLAMLVTAFS